MLRSEQPEWQPKSRHLRRWMLWSGLAAPLCVATSIVAASLARPSISLMHQSISLLSEGPQGFFERLGFVIGGILILLFAGAVHQLWPMARSLVTAQRATGGGLLAAGLAIQQGPAPAHGFRIASPWGTLTGVGVVHIVAAAVFFGALVISCLTVAQMLYSNPRWRHQAFYSAFSGAAIMLLLPAFVITADLGGPSGGLERLAGFVAALWQIWLVRWLQGHAAPRDLSPSQPS